MSAARGQGNALWIAIGLALLIAALILFAAFHVKLPKPELSRPAAASNSTPRIIVKRVEAGSETVELFDKRPLFLPTEINGSDPALPASFRREPDHILQPIPAQYAFAEYEMKVALPEPIQTPTDAVQAMRVGDRPNPFFAFGRINFPYAPVSARLAQLEVLQAGTGRMVLSLPLSAGSEEKLPAVDWQPLEMVVSVEAAGLVGEPTITSGSGFEEVDSYFRNFLLRQLHLGARLPPGFYTLHIGP